MKSLSGARVMVTGASGLIGRSVLELIGLEADVHAVSRFPQLGRDGVRWWEADLSERGAATQLMNSVRPDVLIHLAGAVRGDRSVDAVAPTLHTNLVATVELLEASTRLGCRRIVLSGSLLEEPASGELRAVPPSPYGASRWAASAYARMFHALFGVPTVILRPSFVYGPGQERTKLVPHVVTALLAGESPALSTGDRLLDLVYVADAAEAYLAAAVRPGIEGSTVDLGCGTLVSVSKVVATIVGLIGPTAGEPRFGVVDVRPLEQEVEVDADVADRVLGWRARTTLGDGLRQTVEWYRDQLASEGLTP